MANAKETISTCCPMSKSRRGVIVADVRLLALAISPAAHSRQGRR